MQVSNVPSTGQVPKRAPPPDPESALLDDLAAYSTAACAYAAVAMASPESDRRTKRVRTVFGIPSNRENSNTGLVRRVGCVDGPGGDGVTFDGCYERPLLVPHRSICPFGIYCPGAQISYESSS